MAIGNDRVGLSEKEETIGRLYALRAGLSVVAREKEMADGIMRDAAFDKEQSLAQSERALQRANEEPAIITNQLKEVEKQIELQEEYASSPNLAQRILSIVLIRPLKFIIRFAIMYLVPIFAIVFGALQCAFYGKELSGFLKAVVVLDSDWGIEFIVGGVIIAVILTIIYAKKYLLAKFKLYIRPRWCSLETRKAAPQKLAQLEQEKSNKLAEIATANKKIAQAKKDRYACDKKAAEDYECAKQKATEHAVAGLVMINALDDSFGDIIDMRDWENTDILIYALETRRAENMKEALQVVDGERRTERIVEAVNTAGQEICKSINTGLRRLQGEMTRCFGILGELVVLQGDRIAGHMQDLQGSIAASNSYMAQLTSQHNMTNALMAQANKNSSALVEEATKLRTSVEYVEARRLYGAR